jgi:hypothetical protein
MTQGACELLQEGTYVADRHENQDAGADADRQRRCSKRDRLGDSLERLRGQLSQFPPVQDDDEAQGSGRDGREVVMQACSKGGMPR